MKELTDKEFMESLQVGDKVVVKNGHIGEVIDIGNYGSCTIKIKYSKYNIYYRSTSKRPPGMLANNNILYYIIVKKVNITATRLINI